MTRILSRLAAAFGALLTMTVGVLAEPALWVMRDEDTTIYLFGTVHILDADTHWRSPAIDAAFAASDRLWVEADLLTDQTLDIATILKLGSSPDRPLAARLSPEQHAGLTAICAELSVSPSVVEKLQPWFAAVTLGVLAGKKFGYTETGVDHALLLEAERAGKPVRAFETLREQFEIFAGLSEASALAFLNQTVADLDEAEALFAALIGTWAAGDLEGLERTALAPLAEISPEIFDKILIRRNRNWTETIATRMEKPGTEFVAVGAAHLIGPEGLPSLLAARGFQVDRVPPSAE